MSAWRVREHRGSLAESLATTREIAGVEELLAIVNAELQPFGRTVARAELHVEPYWMDLRCGWDTYLISIDGYGVWGMADGPAPEESSAGVSSQSIGGTSPPPR